MAIGDPNTRPDEETIIVPNSFDLERDARDWEGTALVPWAIHMPRGAGAKDIEDLLREQLRLQLGDVIVAVHQPEPFLIRFTTADQCAAARNVGRFRGRGIDICLRPWRSLSHALGLRIFYRVRLYLDGIPVHACTSDIVERIIGTHCALQYINTDLVQQTDTRHVDLWAWTANPSAIPKRVWLLFTHRPADRSSTVSITTSQPDRWQQGVRYEVFLHLGVLEDYTAAARDLDSAINNPSAFAPIRRGYAWRYGLPDGAPSDACSNFPARLPRPSRDTEPRADDDRERRRDNGVHGHQDQDKNFSLDDISRCNDRNNRRGGNNRSSCRDSFFWPRRPDDDDNDDSGYDHPGRGRDRGSKPHGSRGRDVVRRDRTRSPRRIGSALQGRPSVREVELALNQLQLPGAPDPPATDVSTGRRNCPNGAAGPEADFIRDGCFMSQLPGLTDQLGPGTSGGGGHSERSLGGPGEGGFMGRPAPVWPTSGAPAGPAPSPGPAFVRAAPDLTTGPEAPVGSPGACTQTPSPGPAANNTGRSTAHKSHFSVSQTHEMQVATVDAMEAQPASQVAAVDTNTVAASGSVDDLFAAPASPILRQPPPRRQRRSFDMSAVRRSARLALKPSVPALQRAQHNLWRKLGVSDDELRPIEDILQDYVNSHQWPLPDHVIAAMTALFDLDDEGAEQVNEALIQHAGQAVQDIQNELATRQE
uniref:DUF4283 domain-containing protein n=1 Tax=Setaria viridis TaxID=4556 RepID=A0A4U6T8V4_SETVI|nr:hypothetical protein SEVIR_9G447000v2 [Setaria viridis]